MRLPLSLANARERCVLPVPGGPDEDKTAPSARIQAVDAKQHTTTYRTATHPARRAEREFRS